METTSAMPVDNFLESAVLQIVSEAIAQGYHEATIEFAHKHELDTATSDEKYKRYIDAKRQFELSPSLRAFEYLRETTQDAL